MGLAKMTQSTENRTVRGLERLGSGWNRPKQAKSIQNRLEKSHGSQNNAQEVRRTSWNPEEPSEEHRLHFSRTSGHGTLSENFTGNRNEALRSNLEGKNGTGTLYRLEKTSKTAQRVLQNCTGLALVDNGKIHRRFALPNSRNVTGAT